MDDTGRRLAAREMALLPDPEELRRAQESWVARNWPVRPGGWVTVLRRDGELVFSREDF